MNTVVRQHNVWRKYLAAWTDATDRTEGMIFVKMKDKPPFQTSILNVAVDRYFYDTSTITDADKEIAARYYEYSLKKLAPQLNLKFSLPFDYSEKDYFEKNYIGIVEKGGMKYLNLLLEEEFPFTEEIPAQKITNELKELMIRKLFGEEVENEADLIERAHFAIKNPSKDDDQFKFYEYLVAQWLRTRAAKKIILDTIEKAKDLYKENYKDCTEALYPLMLSINATIIAIQLSRKGFFIKLLLNRTDESFITGDTPIVNIEADYKDNKPVDKLVLYYPVSPKIAIICSDEIKSNEKLEISQVDEIKKYNNFIIEASEKQVFADKESIFS